MAIDVLRTRPRSVGERRLALLPEPEAPAVQGFDRDYWIAHCDGYRVDAANRRIGFVERVRAEHGRVVLTIRSGRLGRHVRTISADEVAFIVPRAERIWLAAPDGRTREGADEPHSAAQAPRRGSLVAERLDRGKPHGAPRWVERTQHADA